MTRGAVSRLPGGRYEYDETRLLAAIESILTSEPAEPARGDGIVGPVPPGSDPVALLAQRPQWPAKPGGAVVTAGPRSRPRVVLTPASSGTPSSGLSEWDGWKSPKRGPIGPAASFGGIVPVPNGFVSERDLNLCACG